MKLILISLLISTQCYAGPVLLENGDKAPYQGLLFPVDEANKIRGELIEKDALVEINKSLNKSLDLYKNNELIYQQQKSILLDQNDKLAKSLYEERKITNWERIGLVVLGIGITGLAIYGVKQLR